MRNGFIEKLTQAAQKNRDIMFLTGDLGYKIFDDYIAKCPGQYLNVGVAEQSMVGVAMGMSLEGRRVVVYSIANFHTFRAAEQIRNDICYHKADVKIVATGGGFGYGRLGMSHHATEDYSIMRALPNMIVLTPGDAWEASEVTKVMLNRKGPFYLCLETAKVDTRKKGEVFKFGKIRQIKNGKDATLISAGGILSEVLIAANELSKSGINCRVLSVHSLKPFDSQIIVKAACETGGLITIEENTIQGGLGSAVAEACLSTGVKPGFFKMMGLDNTFSTIVGDQDYLRKYYGIDHQNIIKQVKKLLK